jgi:hypothetical protein
MHARYRNVLLQVRSQVYEVTNIAEATNPDSSVLKKVERIGRWPKAQLLGAQPQQTIAQTTVTRAMDT